MAGPNWTLSDDLKTVTITFPSNPPMALKLSAEAVDELLRNLGEFRANMQPPFPPEFAPGQMVQAIARPAWRTEPDAMLGNTLLHLRDPRFGWLHYMIPKEEAARLAEIIKAQVAVPPDAPKPGQVN